MEDLSTLISDLDGIGLKTTLVRGKDFGWPIDHKLATDTPSKNGDDPIYASPRKQPSLFNENSGECRISGLYRGNCQCRVNWRSDYFLRDLTKERQWETSNSGLFQK